MDENTELIGSCVTLAELKLLGEFVRWQDITARVADLTAAKGLPNGYPLVPSRLPENGNIDLCIGECWKQVKFIRLEGTRLHGDQRIVYIDKGAERTVPYDWYGVAPEGYYTEWKDPRPKTLAGAKLLGQTDLKQQGNVIIHSQALETVDWPYLTFKVELSKVMHSQGRAELGDIWKGLYTVHAADPRVKVEGIISREPWFNTTIAVSHRWLHPHHPDPDGIQYRELVTLSGSLGLHKNQAFLIDYCSLPQKPRVPDETVWFHKHLPGFQAQFKYVTLVLNTGSADYSTRAWCMFELMLASMNRTSRPTLLNHDQLDGPLHNARELATSYVKHSVWNQQEMLQAFRSGLYRATFNKWDHDPMKVALYNASIEGRNTILEKFQDELMVTDSNDKPIILDLLKRLAFQESVV